MSRTNAASRSGSFEDSDPEAPAQITSLSGTRREESRVDGSAREEELVRALVEGRLSLHALPGDLTAREAALVRRRALEEMTQARLGQIGEYAFDVERASRLNCENIIGGAQVPMGVIGPLPIEGDIVRESVFVPLATTEGALVASANRGCAVLRAAGGARVHVDDVGMTRAPVFRTASLAQSRAFIQWVEENDELIREATESTSQYLKLVEIRPLMFGTTVFLRFRFHSGDAMGMNMATFACDRVVRKVIEPMTDATCISLSGNYCVDKKPAAVNFIEGRGKQVFAEVELSAELLRDGLKTTAAELVEVQYRKNLLGSAAAGSLGFNAHYANVLAAFFLATGQDLAQVVEGSMGITCIEERGEGAVHFSIFLPAAPVGAVGGGTALDTQKQALDLMGVAPDPREPGRAALRLAEIMGAAVLAGEVSLMAALSSQHLADAHERLAR